MGGADLRQELGHALGVHLPTGHPVKLALDGADSAIDIDELPLVAVANRRAFWAGCPAAANSHHSTKPSLVLEHQAHPPTLNLFRLHQRCQSFGEFFFHSSCTCGSLLGCRVSGATLRQPWRANMRYTTEAATGCPSLCANAARSGEATKTSPALDSSCQRAKKSFSSSGVSEARRRPPQLGRTASGLAQNWRSRLCNLSTLARPTPSNMAVCSSVAPNTAGSNTAWAQRSDSTSFACVATTCACVTNSISTRRGLAMGSTPGNIRIPEFPIIRIILNAY